MVAVGLDMTKVKTKTLCNIQHVAEVQTYGVEQHGRHADFIQGPDIVTAPGMVRLPPAELHTELSSTSWELDRHDPRRGKNSVL